MQLSIREVARLLRVPEGTVYRWLDEGQLPALRLGDDVRFNRSELLEWATLRRLPVSPELLPAPESGGSLVEALEAGGVRYGLEAADRGDLLKAMVAALVLPDEEDRGLLLELLLARGEHALTPVGDGVAIPHVRQPAVAPASRPIATLFFLKEALPLDAPDRQPVGALFFLVTPTVRVHLHLLSRLASALHDPGLKALLARRAPAAEILRTLRRLEG